MKEAEIWEEIEKEKAKQRQLSGLKNQNVVRDHGLQREANEKACKILAEKVGLGSGRT